MMIVFPGLT